MVNQNEIPIWVIVLTSSPGTNYRYVHNEDEDIDQYGPYAIPSEIMSCISYLQI